MLILRADGFTGGNSNDLRGNQRRLSVPEKIGQGFSKNNNSIIQRAYCADHYSCQRKSNEQIKLVLLEVNLIFNMKFNTHIRKFDNTLPTERQIFTANFYHLLVTKFIKFPVK